MEAVHRAALSAEASAYLLVARHGEGGCVGTAVVDVSVDRNGRGTMTLTCHACGHVATESLT